MAQGILFDQTALLEVECDGEYYSVQYGFHTFQEFHKDDLVSLRITVTQLVRMGVMKTKLAEYFNVHRKSIEKWEKIFQQEGMLGLVNLELGKSKKCDETVVGYIVDLADKLERADGYKDIIIDEVSRLFDIEISREIIRKTLNEHDSSCENDNEKDIRKEREDAESGKGDEGIEVKNGGVLLALPLLESNNISSLIPDEVEKERGYSFKEIVMTISMLLTGGLLKNEEQVKENDSPCMGLILGINHLPVVRTVRRIVPVLLEKLNIKELKQEFAAMFLRLYATRMIFYIDGHFMPYHGLEKILYGYNSLRRMPMKGRTSYVVNLENGRPIYQILSEGKQ